MYKVGVVGTGIISESYFAAFARLGGFAVTAVCDIQPDRAALTAKRFGAAAYTDFRDMAAAGGLDIAVICLPHGLHAEAAERFAESGAHIIVEKPMANTTAECDRMLRAAARNSVCMMVGHLQRYTAHNRLIQKLADSGGLGDLAMITDIRAENYFHDGRPKWFLDKALAGGGIMMNYGAHSLDKLQWITGRKIVGISGRMSQRIAGIAVEGDASYLLTLEGGVTASVAYCGYRAARHSELCLLFTDGAIRFDGTDVWVSRAGGEYTLAAPEEDNAPFDLMVSGFVRAIESGVSPPLSGDYGREIIRWIEKFYSQQEVVTL
ncbi:MAG: Gfo/Idh/MocA family oxidoreductase [Clostridiales bacterium]|jgi:predicted dehydrogenase|nr:Gfo/Idh/MocA family oxidoreductase [Clostridiales bacterium]